MYPAALLVAYVATQNVVLVPAKGSEHRMKSRTVNGLRRFFNIGQHDPTCVESILWIVIINWLSNLIDAPKIKKTVQTRNTSTSAPINSETSEQIVHINVNCPKKHHFLSWVPLTRVHQGHDQSMCFSLGCTFALKGFRPKSVVHMAPVSVGISNRIHHPQIDHCWLVVSTPLKNINQLGLLLPISGKMFQTTTLFTTLCSALP